MLNLVTTVTGSTLYGLNTPESDIDTMGVFVHDPVTKLGLSANDTVGGSNDTQHELAKFVRLLAKGNPTVTEILWAPQHQWLQWDHRWERIHIELITLTSSQACVNAYLGYADQQRRNMISGHSQRKHLIDQYGYDTKTAMHMIRLLWQCRAYLVSGRLEFPIDEYSREVLLNIRNGKYTDTTVMAMAIDAEHDIKTLVPESPLPKTANYATLNEWLARTYKELWGW